MSITHARKMLQPAPEMVDGYTTKTEKVPGEPFFSRQDGKLILEGHTADTTREVQVPTGKKVPSGSMVARDLQCRDCGAGLRPGNAKGHDFYYLVCARINERDHSIVKVPLYVVDGDMRHFIKLDPSEMGEPFPDSVLECGNASAKDIH